LPSFISRESGQKPNGYTTSTVSTGSVSADLVSNVLLAHEGKTAENTAESRTKNIA
jgi:hypothetical protein